VFDASEAESAVPIIHGAAAGGQIAVPPFGSRYSLRTYTHQQLFALWALKQFLKIEFCGPAVVLAERDNRRGMPGPLRVLGYSAAFPDGGATATSAIL
jgi:hypothetical protein